MSSGVMLRHGLVWCCCVMVWLSHGGFGSSLVKLSIVVVKFSFVALSRVMV